MKTNYCFIGIVVELDETVAVRRKYDKGRQLTKKDVWLFGGVERGNNKNCFLIPLEGQRDAATLLPIIKNYVLKGFCINLIEFRFFKGSEIHTDCWAAYNNISQMGMNYIHKTVNHK